MSLVSLPRQWTWDDPARSESRRQQFANILPTEMNSLRDSSHRHHRRWCPFPRAPPLCFCARRRSRGDGGLSSESESGEAEVTPLVDSARKWRWLLRLGVNWVLPYWSSLGAFVLTVVLICGTVLVMDGLSARAKKEEFKALSNAVVWSYQRKIQMIVGEVERVTSIMTIFSGCITLPVFQSMLNHSYPPFAEIEGIFWAPRILQTDRDAFEAKMQQYYREFCISERTAVNGTFVCRVSPQPEYFPITFENSFENSNELSAIVGFDLESCFVSKSALGKAWLTNQMTAIPRIALMDDCGSSCDSVEDSHQDTFGMVLFSPVFQYSSMSSLSPLPPYTNRTESSRSIQGFVGGVFQLNSEPWFSDTVDFAIFDVTPYDSSSSCHHSALETVMYSNNPAYFTQPNGRHRIGISDLLSQSHEYLSVQPFSFADHTFAFVFVSNTKSDSNHSKQLLTVIACLYSFFGLLLVSYSMYTVRRKRRVVRLLVEKQTLLDRLLPKFVQLRLMGSDPHSYVAYIAKNVAVVFVDLVGFTPLTATLTPQQLTRMLTRYFHVLDSCGVKCSMHKIKSIGDAWFGASKLLLFGSANETILRPTSATPSPAPPHLRHPATPLSAPLEIIASPDVQQGVVDAVTFGTLVTQQIRLISSALQVRVGIHCGDVVAGTVGYSKPFFDIWGITVNIAQRLESKGYPNRVHASQELIDHLPVDHRFQIIARPGYLTLKGSRRKIYTYVIFSKGQPCSQLSPRSAAPAAPEEVFSEVTSPSVVAEESRMLELSDTFSLPGHCITTATAAAAAAASAEAAVAGSVEEDDLGSTSAASSSRRDSTAPFMIHHSITSALQRPRPQPQPQPQQHRESCWAVGDSSETASVSILDERSSVGLVSIGGGGGAGATVAVDFQSSQTSDFRSVI